MKVPSEEFHHYDKYLPAYMRFADVALMDRGICNLKFKGISVVPSDTACDVFGDKRSEIVWKELTAIAIDCPPSSNQIDFARQWMVEKVHYQHWTANAKETYEQMVGDECFEGINA